MFYSLHDINAKLKVKVKLDQFIVHAHSIVYRKEIKTKRENGYIDLKKGRNKSSV